VSRPALSVVIPAYDEAPRVGTTLHALAAATTGQDVETIVVDDGSTDDTAAVAAAHLSSLANGSVISLGQNRGKGAAVRAGVLASTGEAVLYMDADLATDLSALPLFLAALDDADVVSGSRTLPDAVVRNGTRDRAAMAWVFNKIVRWSTGIKSHDTQCGFKMFRRATIAAIFPCQSIDRWGFDVEILFIARRRGFVIREVPVRWIQSEGTRLHWLTPLTMLWELVRVRWNHLLGRYRLPAPEKRP
jgi:glycosyltransferase involved in cell wall biosynthesis